MQPGHIFLEMVKRVALFPSQIIRQNRKLGPTRITTFDLSASYDKRNTYDTLETVAVFPYCKRTAKSVVRRLAE